MNIHTLERYANKIKEIDTRFIDQGLLFIELQEGKFIYLNEHLKVVWNEPNNIVHNKINFNATVNLKKHLFAKDSTINFGNQLQIALHVDTSQEIHNTIFFGTL